MFGQSEHNPVSTKWESFMECHSVKANLAWIHLNLAWIHLKLLPIFTISVILTMLLLILK